MCRRDAASRQEKSQHEAAVDEQVDQYYREPEDLLEHLSETCDGNGKQAYRII